MNNLLEVFLLAILQGITEFLPISSSGHLAVLNQWLNYDGDFLLLEIVVHFGTLLSIILFYRKEFLSIINSVLDNFYKRKFFENFLFFVKILIAILPVVVVGLLAKEKIKSIFDQPLVIAFFFFFTAIYLFLTKGRLKEINIKNESLQNDTLLNHFLFHHVLIIGLTQMIAILPGVSRSGMTITTALLLGFSSRQAMFFSFLVAIPVISGATFLEVSKFITLENKNFAKDLLNLSIALFVSFIVGFFSLKILKQFLVKNKFYYFSYYLITITIAIVVIYFFDLL